MNQPIPFNLEQMSQQMASNRALPFNIGPDLSINFINLFIKLVFLIILVYVVILILNFLRDKFITKVTESKKEGMNNLLRILNKLFFTSGFGFILANIVQALLGKATITNFVAEWNNLVFGIILIFVSLGLNAANKAIKESQTE